MRAVHAYDMQAITIHLIIDLIQIKNFLIIFILICINKLLIFASIYPLFLN